MAINNEFPTIITKRNVDSENNPISISLVEKRQIMDNHSCIVLSQLPNEVARVYIDGFTECYNLDEVDELTYYVSYAQGVVYFDSRYNGKVVIIEYEGIGYEAISASRVYYKLDSDGNITETLEEIFDKMKFQFDLIENLGNAVTIIEKLEANIINGQNVHDSIQDDINAISYTSNKVQYILSADWTMNVATGLYETTITHDLNSKAILINSYYTNTDEIVYVGATVVDANTIKLKHNTNSNLTVVLNARYYKPQDTLNSVIQEEVVEARLGEADLKTKITKIDTKLNNLTTVIYPTDEQSVILAKLQGGSDTIVFVKGDYTITQYTINITSPCRIIGNNSNFKLKNATTINVLSEDVLIEGFNFSVEHSSLYGGEAILKLKNKNIIIDKCSFNATKYYHGIVLTKTDTNSDCSNIWIKNCDFTGCGYGILKLGGLYVNCDRLRLEHLKFIGILAGDAIELNIGQDIGYYFDDIYIDGVASNNIPNAGIGIGIAGYTYGGDKTKQTRNGVIKNCIIKNVQYEAIHFEACNSFLIKDNYMENNYTGKGIAIYGSTDFIVENNRIVNFFMAMRDEIGALSGTYIVSSNNNLFKNNLIQNSRIGLSLGVVGSNHTTTAINNVIRDCETGIDVTGKCVITINNNEIHDCITPISFNYQAKGSLLPSLNRIINMIGNTIYENHRVVVFPDNVVSIGEYDLVNFDSNFKFDVFSRKPKIFNALEVYNVKGDIVLDGTSRKIATSNGFTPKLSTSYYFMCTVGQSRVYVSGGGDPKNKYTIGQYLLLKGAGENATDLIAKIDAFVIENSKYYININKPIGTSIAVSTNLQLAEVCTWETF